MELSVYDRLVLLQVLPQKEDYPVLRIVRDLENELSFSEQEFAELKFKDTELPGGGGVTTKWDQEAGRRIIKDVVIGEKANDIIVRAFKKLARDRDLQKSWLPVYERFVPEKERE